MTKADPFDRHKTTMNGKCVQYDTFHQSQQKRLNFYVYISDRVSHEHGLCSKKSSRFGGPNITNFLKKSRENAKFRN